MQPSLLLRHVKRRIAILYGDFGTGCTMNSLQVKFYDAKESIFVIRVARSEIEMVLDVLREEGSGSAAAEFGGEISILHVAGSPRQCNAKLERLTPDDHVRPWKISY